MFCLKKKKNCVNKINYRINMSAAPAAVEPIHGSSGAQQGLGDKSSRFDMKVPHSQLMTQVIGYMLLFSLVIIFITEILIIRDTSNLTNAFKRLRSAGDTGRTLVIFEYILWFLVGPIVLFTTTKLHQRIFIGLGNLAYVIAGVATLLVGIFYKLTGIDRLFLSPSDPNVRKSFWSSFFSNDMDPSVEKVISLLKTASFVIMAVFIGLGVLFTFASLNTNLLYYSFPTTEGTATQFAKFLIDIFVLPFILMIPVLLRIVYVNKFVGRKVLWRRSILIWFLFFVAPTIIFMMFFSLLHVLDDYTYDVNIGELTKRVQAASQKQLFRRAIVDELTKKTVVKNGEPFENYATAHKEVAAAIKGLPDNFVSALNSYLFTPTQENLIYLKKNNTVNNQINPTGQLIIDACLKIQPPQQSPTQQPVLSPRTNFRPPPPPPQEDQSVYSQYFDENGKPYYYDKRSKVSSYTKPRDFQTAKMSTAPSGLEPL